jgi:hypothetical protein
MVESYKALKSAYFFLVGIVSPTEDFRTMILQNRGRILQCRHEGLMWANYESVGLRLRSQSANSTGLRM